jgi:hypothetical protein
MDNIIIDNVLIVALITALGIILTAAVPSLVTYLLGRKVFNQRKLQEKLNIALTDLQYMLMVEELHCREHLSDVGQTKRQTIRNCVKNESNLSWSGKFTLSRINKELTRNCSLTNGNKLTRPSRYYSRY